MPRCSSMELLVSRSNIRACLVCGALVARLLSSYLRGRRCSSQPAANAISSSRSRMASSSSLWRSNQPPQNMLLMASKASRTAGVALVVVMASSLSTVPLSLGSGRVVACGPLPPREQGRIPIRPFPQRSSACGHRLGSDGQPTGHGVWWPLFRCRRMGRCSYTASGVPILAHRITRATSMINTTAWARSSRVMASLLSPLEVANSPVTTHISGLVVGHTPATKEVPNLSRLWAICPLQIIICG